MLLRELGQRVPALALLGRAHDEFARADVDGAAPWATFFDAHDLAGYRDDMARSRTFALIALSINHLVVGDADEAADNPVRRFGVIERVCDVSCRRNLAGWRESNRPSGDLISQPLVGWRRVAS